MAPVQRSADVPKYRARRKAVVAVIARFPARSWEILFAGHDVDTVVGRGWAGIKNGDLLRRMSGGYDVLITMDRGIEVQQPIAGFPFGVVIAHAASNRLQHLGPLVPAIPAAIASITPGQVQRAGA